jgi:ribonuclease P protein component
MRKHAFPKDEKLTSEKLIQELFEKGSSFYLYPFKVFYMPHPDQSLRSHQVLVTVSRKLFGRAVDRNLIKRRLREAYRLNKPFPEVPKKLVIAYIYSVKEKLPAAQLKERLAKTFKRF